MLLYNTELELYKSAKGKKTIKQTGDYEITPNIENNKIEVLCKNDGEKYYITTDELDRVTPYIIKPVKKQEIDIKNECNNILTHHILRGDHISNIASIYNTTIEKLKELNPDSSFNIGERIRVK